MLVRAFFLLTRVHGLCVLLNGRRQRCGNLSSAHRRGWVPLGWAAAGRSQRLVTVLRALGHPPAGLHVASLHPPSRPGFPHRQRGPQNINPARNPSRALGGAPGTVTQPALLGVPVLVDVWSRAGGPLSHICVVPCSPLSLHSWLSPWSPGQAGLPGHSLTALFALPGSLLLSACPRGQETLAARGSDTGVAAATQRPDVAPSPFPRP